MLVDEITIYTLFSTVYSMNKLKKNQINLNKSTIIKTLQKYYCLLRTANKMLKTC